jgi:radical SAM superfamily enzyme with C-terminal helix-hairpin-helix motif
LKYPDFEIRRLICKFRLSDHSLTFETGRYKKIPLPNSYLAEKLLEHFLIRRINLRSLSSFLKSTCDVNLLSKLSIIFKEWRVMNNVDRGGVIVLFVL